MNSQTWNSVEAWMDDKANGRLFRVWRHRKVFTPLEQEKMWRDQSRLEDDTAMIVVLEEVVELNNGRVMFGFRDAYEAALYEMGEEKTAPPIEYMMDGEFMMESWDTDMERMRQELGIDEDQQEKEQ